MSLKLGNTTIGELYVGSNKIAQAYLGSTLVYQSSAPGPTPTFDEVTIGTQTWMAKNLSIDDGGSGIYQKNNVSANGVNFGTQYYYTWEAASRVADSIQGWHLPTVDEWVALATTVGGLNVAGTKLKYTSGWNNNGNGDGSYDFNALPAGYTYGQDIYYLGGEAYFWTSTPNRVGVTYYYFKFNTGESIDWTNYYTSRGFSVRLIKD